ncbi:MAG: hypothetical protein SF123_02735 [Chloroflexota bacterium]|nr:hypothetical protein [Chloroflexota bacterium]
MTTSTNNIPAIVEIGRTEARDTLRQRWSNYFVLIYAAVCLIIAINLRDSILNATVRYSDVATGIRANYPANWLVDDDGDYVFQVRDASRVGFKTAIIVDVQPLGLATTTRNLLDALSLDRAQTLSGYRTLEIDETYILPDGSTGTAMLYTYVNAEVNPVLQTFPTIVEGLDVIAVRQEQAIIVTFLADARTFDEERPIFERFLNALEF